MQTNSDGLTLRLAVWAVNSRSRAVHSGGAEGAVAPARKTKCFFSNIVSDFAGLFLVAIYWSEISRKLSLPPQTKNPRYGPEVSP